MNDFFLDEGINLVNYLRLYTNDIVKILAKILPFAYDCVTARELVTYSIDPFSKSNATFRLKTIMGHLFNSIIGL